MQVKLMIRMNHAESRSMCKTILPNTGLLNTVTSTLLPANAFIARTDVTIATSKTKKKLVFDLSEGRSDRMKIIPARGNKKAKENKTDAVIGIVFYFSVFY